MNTRPAPRLCLQSAGRLLLGWFLLVSIALVDQAATAASIAAPAPAPVVVAKDAERLFLSEHIRYVELQTPTSLNELLKNKETLNWQLLDSKFPNLGHRDGELWFQIRLENLDDYATRWIVQLDYPLLQSVDLYRVIDSPYNIYAAPRIKTLFANAAVATKLRGEQIAYPGFVAPLELPARSVVTLYWRASSNYKITFPVILWANEAFDAEKIHTFWLAGVVAGICLIMVIYHALLGFVLRDASYFFYVVYVLSLGFWSSLLQGYFGYFFRVSATVHFNLVLYTTFIVLFAVACFLASALQLAERSRKLWALVIGLTIFCTSAFVYGISTGDSSEKNLSVLFIVVLALTLFSVVAHLAIKKVRSALLLLIAMVPALVVCLFTVFSVYSWFPFAEYASEVISAGFITMILLFSFVLADRINQLKEERVSSQLALLEARQRQTAADKSMIKLRLDQLKSEQAADRARDESKAKTEFLAVMSHEIRTPMNGVLGTVDLLQSTPLSEQQTQLVSTIQYSSESLLSIINDVLDYSKIEADKMTLESVSFDLERMLEECVNMFSVHAKQKGLEFNLIVDPALPMMVKGDPTRLRQILNNLLGNAFKFTAKGSVKLRVFSNAEHRAQNLYQFEVIDSGIGLSEEQRARLFKPFSQADFSTSRKYGGTGLGLVISKRLAELMGGKIGVVSQLNQGASFWFSAQLQLDTEHESQRIVPQLQQERILVVEENRDCCRVIEAILNYWQASVKVCESGRSAISELKIATERDQPYTKLILSQSLSDIAPRLVIKALTMEHRIRNPDIILLKSLDGSLQDYKDAELFGVVDKPVTAARLRRLFMQGNVEDLTRAVSGDLLDHAAKLKVLVAEDNPVNQMVIKGLLRRMGVEPELVLNGKEAVEKATQKGARYDLIFMDCEMPEMDGYAATEHIREYEKRRAKDRVTIVACTAHALDERRSRAVSVGMDDYLTKPIKRENLERIIQREIRSRYQNIA